MRLIIVRCGICDSWIHNSRNHCPYCGSTRAMMIAGKRRYFDSERLKNGNEMLEMVRGVPGDYALRLQSMLSEVTEQN